MFEPGCNEPARAADDVPEAQFIGAWESDAADEGWLVSYADMLSVILAMVVLLLGRLVLAGAVAPAASATAAPLVPRVAAAAPDSPLPAAGVQPELASGAEPGAGLTRGPAEEPDPESLLLPSPARAAVVADAQLMLRQLPDADVLLGPTVKWSSSLRAEAPEVDALDLSPWPSAPSTKTGRDESSGSDAKDVPSVTREGRLARLIEERFRGEIVVQPQDTGVLLTIADVVLFDSASAELAQPATRMLTALAMTLREAGDVHVSVEGHTDSRPMQDAEFASNWDLAAARANAVTRFLLARGFDPSRVHSVSYADTRPVADNGTAAGRAANRRVELRIEFSEDADPRVALVAPGDGV
jgi:chemotaxis protein MotB